MEYDPLVTMAALNMAIVSLHRITSTGYRVIQAGRLRKEELAEYDELQRKLLGASWNLLRQYGLPDSCLLTQGALGKFGEVWRPVLRKCPYRAEAVKFRIVELVSEELSEENAEEILRCLAEVRENSEFEDWANNIYMGMMYFALGLKEKAAESVICNIDFGFET